MKLFLIIIGIITSGFVVGQESTPVNFLSEIETHDVADLWTLKKFKSEFEDSVSWVDRSEPLGYIGDAYQRFYIHFISVVQNPHNKLGYFVYGKTRVKTNYCTFHGVLKIKESKTYLDDEFPSIKQGYIKGDYEFKEDSDQMEAGMLKGKFKTDFYIDKNGLIRYNALMFAADGFENNQFEGSWTRYKSTDSKKCNWGDYRIPDSKELDHGAGEFSVSEKYASNGWMDYTIANDAGPNSVNIEGAKKREQEKWWLDKEK